MIDANDLSKSYGPIEALRGVTFHIAPGEIVGLLGPNGAGKSSLMRTIATLQEADSGSASLDDINIFQQPGELRKVLGYLPQEFGVYPRITAEQLLDHICILKGITNGKER
ncbi:MAG: ATP-binding cassette domain-containing protein, partial [Anaerolineae bacterium]